MPKRKISPRRNPVVPPRSLYRKIQSVIEEARRGRVTSKEDLIEKIESRGYVDFTRYRLGPGRAVEVVPCSREAVSRVVDTCVSLGMIDDATGKLTRDGVKASDPSEFEGIMRRLVAQGLSLLDAPLPNISRAITQLLTGYSHETLPTWDAIYERLGISGRRFHKETFRSYLTLLSLCHGISFSRKKIYLPE